MPESDVYEYQLSNLPQNLMKSQPFSNYQYNYINDINSGIYSNTSQSLVQFDLSALYNSSTWTNSRSHFIVIPIIRVAEAKIADGTTSVALTNNNYYLTALKNLNTCLIHQIDLQIGGKSVHQLTPFINLFNSVKMLSQLSNDDLELMGDILGIQSVDNPRSMTYKTSTPPLVNNYSYPGVANNYINGTPTPNIDANNVSQGSGQGNLALQLKTQQNRCVDVATLNGLQLITPSNQLNQEFQSTFEIVGNQAVWKDYCVIFLKDILDAMDKIGLVRRLDAILRIYVNTGFVKVSYPAASQLLFAPTDTTFTDTTPVIVCHNRVLPVATAASLNVGVFIGRAPNYSFNSSNFSGIASPMQACRYYYNSVTLQPSLALDYISSNSSKTVIYDNVLYNTFSNISAGASFSQLVQSGVTNISSIILIPLVGASVSGFSAYKSPFDPVGGASGHPISLTNLQISVGGVNQLATSLNYCYENFIEQVSKFNKSSSSEYGVESGLLSQSFWNNNRFYIVNVRSTEDDLTTARNLVVSFNNNSAVAIDVLMFVQYSDKFTINVSTGMITK